MDLDQLRLFVDLVQTQNFTKVAERNCLTQPAVSLSLQKLEDELGARLLERTTRRVLVTEDGRLLYEYASGILNQVAEVRGLLHERQKKVVGTLRLATVHSIGLYELPPTLRAFIRRYPEANLHVDYLRSDQVYQAVQQGEADLGLVAYGEVRSGLTLSPFFSDELVVICGREHPFSLLETVRLRQLDGESLVAFDHDIPTRKAVDQHFETHGVRVNISTTCDNIEILKHTVEAGAGVGLAPRHAVRQEVALGYLHALPIRDLPITRPLGLLQRKGKHQSHLRATFSEMLIQEGQSLLAEATARDQLRSAAP